MEELSRFSAAHRGDRASPTPSTRVEPFSLFPSGSESRKRRIDALSGSPLNGSSSPSSSYSSRNRPVAHVSDSPPRAVEIESEPAVLHSPPQMHMWSASAAAAVDAGGPVTRTTSPDQPASSHGGLAGKNARLQDRDALYGAEQQAANKRYRASPFSALSTSELFPSLNANRARVSGKTPVSAFTDVYHDMGLPGYDAVTPEEQYHAHKEGSQNLMEALSISQQNTQECTQTLEESPNMCVMRLVVHRDVDRALTAQQRTRLEQLGLYSIDLDRLHPRTSLGRDAFTKVFDKSMSGVDPIKLSRTHCVVECISEPDSTQIGVYVTDKSTNGIRINGNRPDKNKKVKLKHRDVITMLSGRNGLVLLGYVVEDPHVLAAVGYTTDPSSGGGVAVTRSLDESQHLFHVQEHTLGVLFAAPIVGKDVQGKYHPIAELDIKREYSILQESLMEASKYARRPTAMATENGAAQEVSTTLFQYPNQINVRAMFANTENFRSIVTVGCNALHFSGHGDERHLYFEDGMGLVHPVPHSSLQELFSAGGEATLRLVFVSACSSAPLAQAFVSCGIPHVIGVKSNQKIEDYAAIEFTRSFYLALATGKSVGASFMIAQQAVAKSPNIRNPVEVAQKFVLLPENGDHSEVIFPLVTKAANSAKDLGQRPKQRYPKLWYDDLPALCQGFCNRAVEVYKICLALMLTQSRITRLVTITGETGIGKTTVAHAVMNYVAPRISCDGGVKLFSVAKLAMEQLDRSIAVASRSSRHIDSGVRCDVLPTLETTIREHLKTVKAKIELQSKQLLLVLDGCDHLLKTPERRDRFRRFLSDLLTNHAWLKIMITARTSITTNGAVAGHGERVYTLSRFSAKMAAKMLLSLVSRPIRLEEIRKAQLNGSTTDKMDLIASHPALMATLGIPQRVADLAGRLNEVHMDDIPVDAAAMEPME